MGLKIGVIAGKTGVPASTIRYYVSQGLLPEPDRVNKSMSYYDESCIEKIKAIRYLQDTKYYPLTVIKNILKRMDEGFTLQQAEAIDNLVFGPEDKLVDIKEFINQTGLSAREVEIAEAVGVLLPFIAENDRKLYDKDDIRFAKEVLKGSFNINIDIKDIENYLKLAREFIEFESQVRRKIVKGLSREDNLRITLELVKNTGLIHNYIFSRLFQRKIKETVESSLKKEVKSDQ